MMTRSNRELTRAIPTIVTLALIALGAARGAIGADQLVTLARFTGTNGDEPVSGVVLDQAGNLYGTTSYGGINNSGLVYKVSPQGVLTSVHDFERTSGGWYPVARLAIDGSGTLYGTTQYGGSSELGVGSVFKIASDGTFTNLHNFSGDDGSYPASRLTLDSQGNLYGTTTFGGANDEGTVFSISASGVFSTLYSFASTDGASPSSGVVIDSRGNLFGATYTESDPDSAGTIYSLSPGGVLTTLYSFSVLMGGPIGDLAMDSSGNLYGTTQAGGDVAYPGLAVSGTVFKLSKSGTLKTLHQFHGYTIVNTIFYLFFGEGPTGGLTLDAAGNLYGTSYAFNGFRATTGSIYKISPDGAFSTVAELIDGTNPNDGLAIDARGTIYGTQQFGLDVDEVQGIVFKLLRP